MAWTGNFKDQIDDLAGTLVSADDNAIQQWIIDGCYDIVKKAINKNGDDETWKFTAKSTDQTSNGFDIDEIRTIAAVLRNNVFANKGKWGLNHKYKDANSIYAPTDNTPIWIIDNDQIYVWPAPTPSAPANYYYIPEYTLTSWSTGTSSIDNFPSEYYYYAMLYGAMKVLHRRMLDIQITTSPSFEVLPVAPDVPIIDAIENIFIGSLSDASIVYNDATANLASTLDVDDFTGAPVYTAPVTALSALENFAAFSGTLANLSVGATPPVAISSPSISSPGVATIDKGDISGDVPTYTKPSTEIIAVVPDMPSQTAVSYSSVGNDDVVIPSVVTTAYIPPTTVPVDFNIDAITIPSATITAPSITAEGIDTLILPDVTSDVPLYNLDNTAIGFTSKQFVDLATKTITSLSLSSVPPDSPTIQAVEYSPAADVTMDAVVDMSVSDMVVSDIAAVASSTATTSSQASSNIPAYTLPSVMGGGSLLSEMAAGTIAEDGPAFDPDPEKWFSILGQMIEDEEDIELANAQMQKISTFLNAYQADTQNNLNKFNEENVEYQQKINEATSNIQAQNQIALQNMQKDLTIAQANLQKNQSIEQANKQMDAQVSQTNMQKEVQRAQVKASNAQAKALQDVVQATQVIIADNNVQIQKYQAELTAYQAEIGTEVQEYTQNTQKEIQLWQNQQQSSLQQHSQQMADALNVFNSQNARYQANIQAEMLRAQSLGAENQKEADIKMQAKIQDYTFRLQEWGQEIQIYQTKVSNEVQEYQQTLAKYASQQQDAVQTANIANQAHLQQAQQDLQGAIRNKDKATEVAIQNSINTMQAIIQDNNAKLAVYNSEVTAYGAEVSSAIQVIQSDIQNELNEFNKENVKYQANIQAELAKVQIDAQEAQKEADLTLQASIQDYTSQLQKFQGDVTSYQAQVNGSVSEYTQNLQKALQTWTAEQANRLSRYQSEQQDSVAEFNEDNMAFQADVQKQLAEYQADIQIAIKNADATTQIDLANKSKDMEALLADYNAAIQQYQAELQKSAQDLQASIQTEQNKLAKYSAELQGYGADLAVYQADASSKLQKYQADVQAQTVDYQWLQDQYARLTREYEMAFAVPQQAGE